MAKPIDNVERAVKRGRKTGTLNKKTLQKMLALEQVRAMVAFDIIPMVDAQIKKAKDGDTQAFNAIMDRAYGKAVQGVGFIDEQGKVLPQPIMNIMLAPHDDAREVLNVPHVDVAPVMLDASDVAPST